MIAAALGRTLSRLARIDMRLNPSGSKESKVTQRYAQFSLDLLKDMVALDGCAPLRGACRSSKFLAAPRRRVCSLETLFWKKEKDGANLDLPPFSREDCEHKGDIAQLVER